MSVRAIFAAALAAAALPFAAPVAAQAESRDCIVVNNYRDNLLELMEQSQTLSQDAPDQNDFQHTIAVSRDIAAIYHTLNVQISAMASQLISPVFKKQMYAWASASERAGDFFRAIPVRTITQADNDKLDRDLAAFKQGSADFRDTGDAACNV